MKIFDRFKKAVSRSVEKIRADTGLAKSFKDIFEIGGVPAFNHFYYYGIFLWKYI